MPISNGRLSRCVPARSLAGTGMVHWVAVFSAGTTSLAALCSPTVPAPTKAPGRAAYEGYGEARSAAVVMLVGMVLALLVGWLAGMVTRQRSSHWCPVDGSQLKCLECARAGLNVLGSPDDSRPAAPVVA